MFPCIPKRQASILAPRFSHDFSMSVYPRTKFVVMDVDTPIRECRGAFRLCVPQARVAYFHLFPPPRTTFHLRDRFVDELACWVLEVSLFAPRNFKTFCTGFRLWLSCPFLDTYDVFLSELIVVLCRYVTATDALLALQPLQIADLVS
jgi:hypothetical protein